MSALVRLSSKLPGDEEVNGLDHIAGQLARDSQPVMALVWLDVAKVTHDLDAGTDVPTVRVRRLEPIGGLDAIPPAVAKLAEKLFADRTGRAVLPIDLFSRDDEQ